MAIGTFFLYKLLGVSCFYGLALTFIFLPLNHFAGNLMVGTEEELMKARDERVGLMNEVFSISLFDSMAAFLIPPTDPGRYSDAQGSQYLC